MSEYLLNMENNESNFDNSANFETAPEATTLAEELEILGDEELAQFLRAHANDPLLVTGESRWPRNRVDLHHDFERSNLDASADIYRHLKRDRELPETNAYVIGNIPEEKKRGIERRQRFYAHDALVRLEDDERPKTLEETARIEQAIRYVNELRERYNLAAIDASADQIHSIANYFVNDARDKGTYMQFELSIMKAEAHTDPVDLEIVTHELLHLGSHSVLIGKKEDDARTSFRTYRIGLKIVSSRRDRNGEHVVYLSDLNEAVTEELTKRFVQGIDPADPVLGYIAERRKHNIELFAEIYGEEAIKRGDTPDELIDIYESGEKTNTARFTYKPERDLLHRLTSDIAEKIRAQRGESADIDHEKVFDEIARGYFAGNIMPFARLFEEAYGRGSFREFGRLSSVSEKGAYLDKHGGKDAQA